MKNKNVHFLTYRVPREILLYLRKNTPRYGLQITLAIQTTTSTIYEHLRIFEEGGIVTLKRDGRRVMAQLTPKGVEVQKSMKSIIKKVKYKL